MERMEKRDRPKQHQQQRTAVQLWQHQQCNSRSNRRELDSDANPINARHIGAVGPRHETRGARGWGTQLSLLH